MQSKAVKGKEKTMVIPAFSKPFTLRFSLFK
jgi:hypothetical protein